MTDPSSTRISRKAAALWSAAFAISHGALAGAEEAPRAALGIGDCALPALIGVAVPLEAPILGLSATAGYGYTESIGAQRGANHRAAGTLAAAYSPAPWVALALRIDGRYDRHPADAMGGDFTMVGDPRIVLRLRHELGEDFHAGAEGLVWFPGRDAPSIDWASTSPEGRALVTWSPGATTVAASVGFRRDRSAATLDDSTTPRLGDQISSGVSDFDALLLGLGVAHRIGAVTAIADVTQDLLVGSDAPPVAESPLVFSAGARVELGSSLTAEGFAQAAGYGRANQSEYRVRIAPRVGGFVGLRYVLGAEPPPAPIAAPPPPPPPPPLHLAPQPVPVKPEAPKVATVVGHVTDEGGNPIPDVLVMLETANGPPREVRTDGSGAFEVSELEFAQYKLRTRTPGFEQLERELAVSSEKPEPVDVTLYPALPAGQLRGLVQSFEGKPLKARLEVSPGNVVIESGEDGTFSVDIPPGTHTVEIMAEGYLPQRRTVRVENRGVTVINADLRSKPR